MAVTLNNFWGAETGGLEECSATGSSPSASSADSHSGTYSFALSSTPDTIQFDPFESVPDAGIGYIIGFWVNMNNNSWVSSDFLRVEAAASAIILQIETNTSEQLVLKDQGGTTRITSSTVSPTTGWHFIEIYFELSGANSDCELFIDGVSEGTSSVATFTSDIVLIEFLGSAGGSNDEYIDDIYFLSGCTSSADRLGGSEVFAYRSSKASVTPDTDAGAGSAATFLDAGHWADAQEVPFSSQSPLPDSQYTRSGAAAGSVVTDDVGGSAGTGGPNTDANITGTIKAIKGIWRMSRDGGSNTAHYGLLGNDSDGTTRSADFDPSTSMVNYFMVSESATVVPTSSEHAQIGFEKSSGGQIFECEDMLAMVLHVPVPADPNIQPDSWTDTVTYHDPTLDPGIVSVLPDSWTDTVTYYEVSLVSLNYIQPDGWTDTVTYYDPTLDPGIVSVLPDSWTDTVTVYEPVVGGGIGPDSWTDTVTYYDPTLDPGIVSVLPDSWTDTVTYYDPTLAAGVVNVLPDSWTDTVTYYDPTLDPGIVSVLPDSWTDTVTYYDVSVVSFSYIQSDSWTDTVTYYDPTLDPGIASVLPDSWTDTVTYHDPTLNLGTIQVIFPNFLAESTEVYNPTLDLLYKVISPNYWSDVVSIPSPTLIKEFIPSELEILGFKRDSQAYIVYLGNIYTLDISDVNYSQTFTEKSYNSLTLQQQNYFEAGLINKVNPANFSLKIPALREADLEIAFNRALDCKTFDLYIKQKQDLVKIENCVITGLNFVINRQEVLGLVIEGEGSRLTRVGDADTATIPGSYVARSNTRTYNLAKFVKATLNGADVYDKFVAFNVALTNNIKWVKDSVIADSCGPNNNVTYPTIFNVESKELAGSFTVNEIENFTPSNNSSLFLEAGEQVTGSLYGFEFNLSDIAIQSRVDTQDIFKNTYMWNLNQNVSDLSQIIKYKVSSAGAAGAIQDYNNQDILDYLNNPILESV
jgi:hypothetical protein